ncbi:MAG: hypothetical protein D6675_16220 [Gemmatimonadetes bacterium]|nr:MAG: hypothetical protein D6675_16220 [Gemmatimonadota bacterium]
MMLEKPVRTAIPGDICVLLEPDEVELELVRTKQKSLQAIFGGHFHSRVHLTCQRFALPDDQLQSELIHHLRERLMTYPPFTLTAVSLISFYAEFWQSYLLRWKIRTTEPLHRFRLTVEEALHKIDITPHYPSNWNPTLVTALEEISILKTERYLAAMNFPYQLFRVRQVVLSKINGVNNFEILETIPLENY